MVPLLPVRKVLLVSDLPPAALAEVLRGVVGVDGAPFAGAVGADRLVITRMNEYRSTFMPLMHGTLAPGPDGGTLVCLRLRPDGTVFVFMSIWLSFLVAAAALIVAAHAHGGGRGLLPLLAPAGLAAASWLLMSSVFGADSHWAIVRLLEAVPALRPAGTA